MLTRHDTDRERGSALVMAIIFVTVVGLAVTMGLGYSAVSLRASTRHYEPARDRLYAADAAVKAAIQSVVAAPSNGRSNADGSCKASLSFGSVDGDAVTVVVCPQGSNSLTVKGGGSGWGVLTLATGTETGLKVRGKLQVYGNTYANSTIDATNGEIAVDGGLVKALGGCSGVVKVDGVSITSCTVGTAPAVDPGWLPGVTAPPAVGSGACDGKTEVATLAPGTWTQSTFDAAVGSCDDVWLQSGVHYLENIVWKITGRVVAGSLAVAASAIDDTPVGSACTPGTGGATLVLGGTTQLSLKGDAAALEVCGASVAQASGGSVTLPLYGPTADIASLVTVPLVADGQSSGAKWVSASDAVKVDAKNASHPLKKSDVSDVLGLTGYGKGASIPATVTKLTAEVTGYATAGTTYTVTVRTNTGDATKDKTVCTTDAAGTFANKLGTTTVNLTCNAALAPGSRGLTAQVVATAGGTGPDRTVYVDGVVLKYVTMGPAILAQSGCVVTPGTGPSSCAVLQTEGNKNEIFLDGEVYLPKAKVAVKIQNQATAFSTLGIVVRVLDVQTATANAQPAVATNNGNLNDGDVTVQALVGGTAWMTCRVTFTASGQKVTATSVRGCTVPR